MHLFGSRTRPLRILPVVLQLLRSMASSVFVMLTAPSAKHSGSRSGPCRHLSLIWPSARRSDPPSSCKTLGEQWMELQSQQFVMYIQGLVIHRSEMSNAGGSSRSTMHLSICIHSTVYFFRAPPTPVLFGTLFSHGTDFIIHHYVLCSTM